MSVQHYKNGQLNIIAGAGGIGGGDGENSFTGTKAEVEQAIAAGQIKENWTVYITDDLEDIVNTPGGSNCDCKVEYITQEQYDLLPEDKLTNDIEYRITDNNPATPSAKNMAYDGTASGLEATNVQDAIDIVNGRLNWELAGSSIGNGIINIPSNTKELLCVVNIPDTLKITSIIPYNELTDDEQVFAFAVPEWAATASRGYVECRISKTSFYVYQVVFNNGTIGSTVSTNLYYK